MEVKWCVQQPNKVCDGCNRCNRCDLDPNKLCDNCFRCLDMGGREYAEIPISQIYMETDANMFELSGDQWPDDAGHVLCTTLRGVHGSLRRRRRGR